MEGLIRSIALSTPGVASEPKESAIDKDRRGIRHSMALRSEGFQIQQYVEKAMVDLPALPTVIVQVLQATEKETVTTSEIEGLLSADAAITTKLLKVVNSAYFGLPRQVGSIGQTIAILGMHQVRNLVLSVGVLNALSSPSPKIFEVQKEFWEHSFASATCAQALARRRGLTLKEQDFVFIGGLLHDIGRLFLFTLFNQQYMQVMAESTRQNEPMVETEHKCLGVDHAELGGLLADKWNFPTALGDLIRWHENPDNATSDAKSALFCVHIADRLSTEIWHGPQEDAVWPWSPEAKAWLGYSDDQMTELRLEVQEFTSRAKELLGVL